MNVYFTIGLVFAALIIFVTLAYMLEIFYYVLDFYVKDQNTGMLLRYADTKFWSKRPILRKVLEENMLEFVHSASCWAILSVVLWPAITIFLTGWYAASLIKRKINLEGVKHEEKAEMIEQDRTGLNGSNDKFYGRTNGENTP